MYEKITFRGASTNGEKILQEVIYIHTRNFMYCDGEYSRWRMKKDANRGGTAGGGREGKAYGYRGRCCATMGTE